MDSPPSLFCAATLEWTGGRKQVHKKLGFALVRNEHREMIVQMTPEKSQPIRMPLVNITVHNKFMAEGKASIVFKNTGCTIFLSNAPPADLVTFLRTVFVKLSGDKDIKNVDIRTRLLSSKPKSFEDISPVTLTDIQNAKAKVSKATATTPSPSGKRKMKDGDSKAPAAKKLYAPSPLSAEAVLNEEQKHVLQACLRGSNIFFTGSAGTGKSFLLRKIIAALPPDVTVSTASTGVAACHIGNIYKLYIHFS